MEFRRKRASAGPKMTGLKQQKKKKKKRRQPQTRRERTIQLLVRSFIFAAVAIILALIGRDYVPELVARITEPEQILDHSLYEVSKPEIQVELLEGGTYARPEGILNSVNGIVIHYADTVGSSAEQLREAYAGLSHSGEDDCGSHFIIGLDGEILQCIPCNEKSCASGNRNDDTISITCCINSENEKVGDEEYKSLVHLTAWLIQRYDLEVTDLYRHSDIDSSDCPVYYEENNAQWRQFKTDVYTYICSNATVSATED